MSPRLYLTILSLILLTGIGLRVYVATHRPLHDDEAWSMMLATGRGSVHLTLPANVSLTADQFPETTSMTGARGPWTVPATLKEITHPPGYFTLLGAWRWLAGGSDLTARSLSILASAVFLLLMADAAKRLLSAEAALWVTATLAVARPIVELTSEARPYATVLVGVALGLSGISRLVQPQARTRIALVIVAAAASILLTTHYFAGGVVLAMALCCACLPKPLRWRSLTAVLIPCLLFAVFWGLYFLEQARAGRFGAQETSTQFLHTNPTALHTLRLVLSAPARLLFPFYRLPPGLPALALPLLGGVGAMSWRRSRTAVAISTAFALGGLLAPAALGFISGTTQLEYDRYIMLAFPGFALLGATALTASTRWPARLIPGAMLALAATSMLPRFADHIEDYSRPAELIGRNLADGDIVLIHGEAAQPMIPRTQLLMYSHFATQRAHPLLLSLNPLTPGLLRQLDHHRIFVISFPAYDTDPLLPHHTRAARAVLGQIHAVTAYDPRPD